MTEFVIGIDVQAARGCPYAVMDGASKIINSGWIATDSLANSVQKLSASYKGAVFAIDAPRMALPGKRNWYWGGGVWRPRAASEKGYGRHCEVVVKAHDLANPQWTPLAVDAQPWMKHGFDIFDALRGKAVCLEVFPTASYKMLNEVLDVRVDMSLSKFMPGPKDMLDAVVAALTGHEYLAGRGQEVGDGDGLGTIVLPRPIAQPIMEVMNWPGRFRRH